MTDYTARLRAKGLDQTGVTEQIATNMHGRLGSYGMAVVEYKIVRASNDDDGKHKVELTIEHFEPAVSTDLDEHLRGITRALHTNRVLTSDDGQLTIDGQDDIAPKMADLILAGEAMFFPHADDGIEDAEIIDEDDLTDDDTEGTVPLDPDESWEYDEAQGKVLQSVPNPFTP